MKTTMRVMTGALAGVLMLGSLAGCGRKNITMEDYPNTVVATFGDTNVYLDEANYLARTSQYTTEYYYSMFGYDISEMWSGSMGNTTMETYTKTSTMQAIYQTLVLDKKAEEVGLSLTDAEKEKAAETAESWKIGHPEEMLPFIVFDDELLQNITEKNALAMKAYQYAIKDVDTEVADEDARQYSIKYYQVKETDDVDADAAKAQAEEILTAVKAGDLPSSEYSDAIDNVTYNETSFGEGSLGNKLEELGLTLATGEAGSIYDEDNGYWYVVYMVDDFDQDATEKKKTEIVDSRKDELFNTTYAEWVKEMPEFKVNENVWNLVKFEQNIYTVETATEAETVSSETEAASETETAETKEAN